MKMNSKIFRFHLQKACPINRQQSTQITIQDPLHRKTNVRTEIQIHFKQENVAQVTPIASFSDEIPGPKAWQNISNALQFAMRQITIPSLLWTFRQGSEGPFSKYGPVVKLPSVLGGKILLINRPQDIADVYNQEERYPVRAILDSVEKYRSQRLVHDDMNDTEWGMFRNKIRYLPVENSSDYFEKVENVGRMLTDRIQLIRNRHCEIPRDLMPEIRKWSLECLSLVIFDTSQNVFNRGDIRHSENPRLLQLIMDATHWLCKCEMGFQFWRLTDTPASASLNEACKAMEKIILDHIRHARTQIIELNNDDCDRTPSMLETLLCDSRMTLQDVVTKVLDILLVGFNTASSALGFLLYHMAQNPHAQAKVLRELKCVLPAKNDPLKYEQLNYLIYLQACLKESLRLKMPMPFVTKVLREDIDISNYRIPKGTQIVMVPQVNRLNEKNFDNPEEFQPERWLDTSTAYASHTSVLYCDPKSVLKKQLPEMIICSCAAHILRNFCIEYDYEEIKATNTVISFPDRPLKLRFTEREN